MPRGEIAQPLIIAPRMDAERLNTLADKLKDLKVRSAELRRYL
jgi:hypothetical protein